MVKNRFHSSIKKNIKFLEDMFVERSNMCSYPYSPEMGDMIDTDEISRFESKEDTNMINFFSESDKDALSVNNDFDERISVNSKKGFNNLIQEKAVDFSVAQRMDCMNFGIMNYNNDRNIFSANCDYDDYFVI